MNEEDGGVAGPCAETDGDHRDEHTSGYKVVGFKIGHTFDVSQTEGAPIPNRSTWLWQATIRASTQP